jgi:formate C-acetyltransferase
MKINVRDFINKNYTEYTGDETFLTGPTERTKKLLKKCQDLLKKEKENGGVLDIDTTQFSGITNYEAGYIDKDLELIVGFQTDEPLKRIVNPYGGTRMVEQSLTAYDREMNDLLKTFSSYRKTHNEGVFDAYTPEIRAARRNGLITGLPDAYGRGRIIGDYRRVALYGINTLIKQKEQDLLNIEPIDENSIRLREEVSEQIRALKDMSIMAKKYGYDKIDYPAISCQEAIQHIYFAYLAGAKENNGAATSLGRVSTFIDIYAEHDLNHGLATEEEIQELIDQFILKLRFIRHLRTPGYDALFAGDPTWITEAIGGMGTDGRTLVTKTSYRFLQSLYNLGAAPEPNLTVLWDKRLP